MVYTPVSQKSGSFEIQELPGIVFDTASPVSRVAATSDRFYNPNTDQSDFLVDAREPQDITLTGLFSDPQVRDIEALYNSANGQNGSLTATHVMGNVTTILAGVRIMDYSYGEINKLSNNASTVELRISYASSRMV